MVESPLKELERVGQDFTLQKSATVDVTPGAATIISVAASGVERGPFFPFYSIQLQRKRNTVLDLNN